MISNFCERGEMWGLTFPLRVPDIHSAPHCSMTSFVSTNAKPQAPQNSVLEHRPE